MREHQDYSGWCERNGFKYADKAVPAEWIEEFQRTKRAAELLKISRDTEHGG